MSTSSSAGCPAAVDRSAHSGDRADAAGRGLVVNDADGADLAALVGFERGLDRGGIGAASPVGLEKDRLQSKALRHFAPERCEPARARHQNRVAWRQRVDERGFPRAGARGGKDEHGIVRLEDALEAGQDGTSERRRNRARDGRSSVPRSRAAHGRARLSGPGICRKWRPGARVFMTPPRVAEAAEEGRRPRPRAQRREAVRPPRNPPRDARRSAIRIAILRSGG